MLLISRDKVRSQFAPRVNELANRTLARVRVKSELVNFTCVLVAQTQAHREAMNNTCAPDLFVRAFLAANTLETRVEAQ